MPTSSGVQAVPAGAVSATVAGAFVLPYAAVVSASWNTTTPTSVYTLASFLVTFGTPAPPGGGTIAWIAISAAIPPPGPPGSSTTAAGLIATGLELAGNTSIAQATVLSWLNMFLQSEYRRKYPWQRRTIAIPVLGGVVDYPAAWDATFLDVYMQRDMSVGRYIVSNQVAKLYQMSYREWIVKADRLSGTGPPRYIIPDLVGAAWHVWPVPDGSYAVTVDIYTLPPLLAVGDTPLWSSYAPDEILVQAILVYALNHQDDERAPREAVRLYGDQKQQIPGMLSTYRRRVLAEEGISSTTAHDQTRFLPMAAET